MVSVIIPFYNVGENILGVIDAVSRVGLVSEIVAVDDGSTDGVSGLIRSRFPAVRLIVFARNRGKAEAVFEGARQATCETLFLLDADLKNLEPAGLGTSIKKYFEKKIDLLILENKGDNDFVDRLWGKSIFLSGKRILKKADLLAISVTHPQGYQLEVAINDYMIKNKKVVYWTKNSAHNPHKVAKEGWLNGVLDEIKMESDIIKYIGVFKYFFQKLYFNPPELK